MFNFYVLYKAIFYLVALAYFVFGFVFHARACCFYCVVCVIICFPLYFTNVVQLLRSLSGWLHVHCSSIGTEFNGAKTSCRTEYNLGILLINNNCFAICFQQHL